MPWLDTSKIRSAVFRPLYRQFYWILVADVLILGYVGAMPAEGLYLLIARVATAYYFIHFLAKHPVGKIDQSNIRIFDDIAINSGIYTFIFKDGSSAQARFTFVYRINDEVWKIIEHHSSLLPG